MKGYTMAKDKKSTKEEASKKAPKTSTKRNYDVKNVIIGVLLLTSVLSIGYSTTVTVIVTGKQQNSNNNIFNVIITLS